MRPFRGNMAKELADELVDICDDVSEIPKRDCFPVFGLLLS